VTDHLLTNNSHLWNSNIPQTAALRVLCKGYRLQGTPLHATGWTYMLQIIHDTRSSPQFPDFIRRWQHSYHLYNTTTQFRNPIQTGRPSSRLRNTGYMLKVIYLQVAYWILHVTVRTLDFFTLNAISNKIHFRGLNFKDLQVLRYMLLGRHYRLQAGAVYSDKKFCGFLGPTRSEGLRKGWLYFSSSQFSCTFCVASAMLVYKYVQADPPNLFLHLPKKCRKPVLCTGYMLYVIKSQF
jgi:hypothetical protein